MDQPSASPQRSYTRGSQDKALLAMTIGQAFDNTVAQYPTGEALVVRHQQLRYTWQELSDAVDLHARALLSLGLQTGDRLGIWAPNCAQWCISQIASAKIGVILVNINPAYRSSEVEYALKQSGCQWLVCAGAFKSSNYHGMLQGLVPELAEQSIGKLQCERLPELRGVISLDAQPPSGFLPWSQLADLAASVSTGQLRERQDSLHFDQPVNIQYTSGTTGFPKGATLSHYNSITVTWWAKALA
jgi:fatty-acyl-CoA synthase